MTSKSDLIEMVKALHPDSRAERISHAAESCVPVVATLGAPRSDVEVDAMGLIFKTDYKYEQEAGVGEVMNAVLEVSRDGSTSMSKKTRKHLSVCADGKAFAVSSMHLPETFAWGDDLPGAHGEDYVRRHDSLMNWESGITKHSWAMDRLTVPALKDKAKALGITGISKMRRSDLVDAIVRAEHPDEVGNCKLASATFGYGKTIVVRAQEGSVAEGVVQYLIEAIKSDTFTMTPASSPFHTGLLMYDAQDDTKALNKARKDYRAWNDKQMKVLEKEKQGLQESGLNWHFLGKPREDKDGSIVYWLNGTGVRMEDGSHMQPYGWYSIQDLKDGKHMDDLYERARGRAERKSVGAK